ncbi:hypothetical protein [Apilactobacillus timberlakei]|uniref:hypothetical protein n=1 Tax=Apilactobacillus timberlakei TaxID=2008380 RepID=UPI00112CF84E|nr:hypothetical protein [Apilactobacillus timberlakei]TPR12623.1 hypothetical protein DYZ97_06065 [Apilactobacillus timberlakei]
MEISLHAILPSLITGFIPPIIGYIISRKQIKNDILKNEANIESKKNEIEAKLETNASNIKAEISLKFFDVLKDANAEILPSMNDFYEKSKMLVINYPSIKKTGLLKSLLFDDKIENSVSDDDLIYTSDRDYIISIDNEWRKARKKFEIAKAKFGSLYDDDILNLLEKYLNNSLVLFTYFEGVYHSTEKEFLNYREWYINEIHETNERLGIDQFLIGEGVFFEKTKFVFNKLKEIDYIKNDISNKINSYTRNQLKIF